MAADTGWMYHIRKETGDLFRRFFEVCHSTKAAAAVITHGVFIARHLLGAATTPVARNNAFNTAYAKCSVGTGRLALKLADHAPAAAEYPGPRATFGQ